MMFQLFAAGIVVAGAGGCMWLIVEWIREDGTKPSRVELDRLTAPLAAKRTIDEIAAGVEPEPVTEPIVAEWPQRQTPTDLQAAYEPDMPQWPWTLPPEPGLGSHYPMYEQWGVNRVRPVEVILAALPGPDTQVFQVLVGSTWTSQERQDLIGEAADWKCDSCLVGRDGEHQHQSCTGCGCHCGDSQGAEVVPIGGHQRHVDAVELEGRAAA